ncbi:prephenate dehydratase [Deefgea salmonis]|uniref:Bifunctional chorismate mutase/prephenate dehydratase n=1 Tax=Deefgea salmonis TaxID=2875502 RepID=A0ABS8BJP8_9NEIS|nr:prephenate dehydratase [Deefgea salmonis]MCB5195948.1 prephenate dehydratase [Deefgea salmonis]
MSDDLLKQHRDAIDAIDQQILALINQRAQHARTIGEIKGSGVVYRPEREAQVLTRIKDTNPGPLSGETCARLFREIMSACLALERPLTIAFLGPEGTFTQAAAIKHFGHAASTLACASIDEAFRVVEARGADYVVAPVENSTEGAVGRTLDLMVTTPLQICGEVVLRIHHHFLRQTTDMAGIKRVYSHAQSLAQCHEWLNKHLGDEVERISVASNAEGARLASLDPSSAAIAGDSAAEKFALNKLAVNIEDEPNNTTRFLVLGYQQAARSGKDKTSLVISAPNRPGALHTLVEPLARNGVSMSKFESRPSRTGLWEYVFFADVDGFIDDVPLQAALKDLQDVAAFVKVLGSYPQAVI